MTFPRPKFQRYLLPIGLAILGAIACMLLLPAEQQAVRSQISGFPDADATSHLARIPILAGLCFLPAVAGICYCLGGTLDRYVARRFFSIFLICMSALLIVWLLIDFQDNIGDFLETKNPAKTMAQFYSARSSAIVLFLMPYALLLSLLYSLGHLSSTREIVAMVQSGRGIIRITAPLIIAGLFGTLLCIGLNYQWAPVAEGSKDKILDTALGKSPKEAADVLYYNADKRRLWLVGAFPPDYEKGQPLRNVEITTTRADGSLKTRLSAKNATWQPDTRKWIFNGATTTEFTPGEPPIFTKSAEPKVKAGWKETPWQLIKPGLSPTYLGVPDLTTWLSANTSNNVSINPAPYQTQWHYRWALPFTCLVTVLLATPLAIHFSRRGPGGSVFVAVVLSALMLLFSNVSLVLGEASILPPALAAWLPNLIFALIGIYLFQRRINGRPIYQAIRSLTGTD
ncbi:LptF/LptG family permease [Luteolibacter pohnpeiensis]|uniref:LptF/LptG family permease n=1 Tax=Luteolibacter pohnpeiensis TaxID=454153 RepID=A0A934S2F2_9BACT|nr:LptF/LptG family permease [Luteolibacter pohnpeiensis]MBK1881186.1 LptF/LptG family permease [Luteolibacter pohnpeiensis]